MAPTVAEQVVEVLQQAGAKRIYGVVGDSLNPIVDAVRRAEGIEWVHVRNEEAGAAGTKIVLGGGVGRMLEMARSNLRNIPLPT